MRNLIFIFISLTLSAQDYSVSKIPNHLLEDANAVIRFSKETVTLNAVDEMVIEVDKAITVLNKEGDELARDLIYYRPSIKPKKYYAYFYDANGKEIKRVRKKDYKDFAAVDGISLYSEDRVLANTYKPNTYPYTIAYHHEIKSKNTAFLPNYYPINDFNLAVENSEFTIINKSKIQIREKVYDSKFLKALKILKNDQSTNYSINNQKALKRVSFSPPLENLITKVLLSPQVFELENKQAEVNNWEDFGKWMYKDLIQSRQELTDSEKKKVHQLTDKLDNVEDKVKVLYQYMQDRTRYILVNIGIGGWQPTTAKEVSSLGYGDCKGLSNYMMALLKEANIASNYTVVYGNPKYNQNINEDFVSIQGNHVILNVPISNDTLWLECTSQQISPGELGRFTSNRKALSINENGGKIVNTKEYNYKDNRQSVIVTGNLDINGVLDLNVESTSTGVLYADQIHLSYLQNDEKYSYLKSSYAPSASVLLKDFEIQNDISNAKYLEKFKLNYSKYYSSLGNEVIYSLFPFEIFNISLESEERAYPVEIQQGYHEEHLFKIKVPDNFTINYTIEPIMHNDEFGSYSLNYELNDGVLIIKRDFTLFKGDYPADKYKDIISFFNKIRKADATKILFSI